MSSSRSAMATLLADRLARRLPGLPTALEADFVAEQIAPTLLDDGVRLDGVQVGSMWCRDDGSCSVRYRLRVWTNRGPREHTAMGRVCAGRRAAADYLAAEVLPLLPDEPAPTPWRRWAVSCADVGLVVHAFPIDPAVPTLARCLDLRRISTSGWPWTGGTPTSVDVVRHTRGGTAVLRYGVQSTVSDSPATPTSVYGKVYSDTTGQRVSRALGSLSSSADLTPGAPFVRLPASLGYQPDLRLLLTDELPGRPLLPALLRAVVSADPGSPGPGASGAVLSALRAAGQALAALHAHKRTWAPVQPPGQPRRDVERELDQVALTWPDTADLVRAGLDRGTAGVADASTPVLCHGDYTPSQVLFTDGAVSGLVDLDTVCWGDPAMDLGRFLAHLDLGIAKAGGSFAEPWAARLGSHFLAGYGEAAGRRGLDSALLNRTRANRSIGLAFSALHACRALKEHRLDLALSLLNTADDWKITS